MPKKMTAEMVRGAIFRAMPSLPEAPSKDGEGRMRHHYPPATMRRYTTEAMIALLVDLGLAEAGMLTPEQLLASEVDPRISEAGLMDLACAVVKVVQSPEAADHFQNRPTVLKEAAIRLQLAAENYVEVAGGMSFSPSGKRLS